MSSDPKVVLDTTASSQKNEVSSSSIQHAFDSFERKLDAGLADLADELVSKEDDGNHRMDGSASIANETNEAGVQRVEEMVQEMAKEAASFAKEASEIVEATQAMTEPTDDDAVNKHSDSLPLLKPDDGAADEVTAQHLRERTEKRLPRNSLIVPKNENSKTATSSKRIIRLLVALFGIILALGAASIGHSSRKASQKKTDADDDLTIFDIVKDWNTRYEQEQRYREAMRNMLNPPNEETNGNEQKAAELSQEEIREQYADLESNDGQLSNLVYKVVYRPVYFVARPAIRRFRYYYYPTQSHVYAAQGQTGVTYRKATVVQNRHRMAPKR